MKNKISNKEKIRRTIQSQIVVHGYVSIGNIEGNFIIG